MNRTRNDKARPIIPPPDKPWTVSADVIDAVVDMDRLHGAGVSFCFIALMMQQGFVHVK